MLKEDNLERFHELQRKASRKFIISDEVAKKVGYLLGIEPEAVKLEDDNYRIVGKGKCKCGETDDRFELYVADNCNDKQLANLIAKCGKCSGKLVLYLIIDTSVIDNLNELLEENVDFCILEKGSIILPTSPLKSINLETLAKSNGEFLNDINGVIELSTEQLRQVQSVIERDRPIKNGHIIRDTPSTVKIMTDDGAMISINNPEDHKKTIMKYRKHDESSLKLISKKTHNIVHGIIQNAYNEFWRHKVGLSEAIINITVNNTTVYNGDDDNRLTDVSLLNVIERVGIVNNFIITTDKMYIYRSDEHIWKKQSINVVGGTLVRMFLDHEASSNLSPLDRKYLENGSSSDNLIKRLCNDDFRLRKNERFKSMLDANPYLLPFSNGVYDLSSLCFRETRREDYITCHIGYALPPRESIDPELFKRIDMFYKQVFPVLEERELFLRFVGYALLGHSKEKVILLLTDKRRGYNGKSTMKKALDHVFGNFAASASPSLLYESSFTESANAHSANVLAYQGKRIANFDELKRRSLDLSRLKSLAGGDSEISGRRLGSEEIVRFNWSAKLLLYFNISDLKIDASDGALISRIKVIPFRSKFSQESVDRGEEYAFPPNLDINDDLKTARCAHMWLLLDAYARYQSSGLGMDPASCTEFKNDLIRSADPLFDDLLTYCKKWLVIKEGEHVVRSTLLSHVDLHTNLKSIGTAKVKAMLDEVLETLGVKLLDRKKINGKGYRNVYCNVSMKTELSD